MKKKKEIKNKDYRLEKYFVGGQLKKYKVPLINGMEVEEFIRRNADDAYLMAEGHWGILHEREVERDRSWSPPDKHGQLPF